MPKGYKRPPTPSKVVGVKVSNFQKKQKCLESYFDSFKTIKKIWSEKPPSCLSFAPIYVVE